MAGSELCHQHHNLRYDAEHVSPVTGEGNHAELKAEGFAPSARSCFDLAMRYRIDGATVLRDAGLGEFAVGLGDATCTDNPRWQPSAFDKKAWWCMCGAGPSLRRCPGCCGSCPPCPARKCQQQPYKVFESNAVAAFDCKCGPCAPMGG